MCVREHVPDFVLPSVQPGNQDTRITQPQTQTCGPAALGLCTQVLPGQPDLATTYLLSRAAPSEALWGHPHAGHSQAPAPIPVGPQGSSGQDLESPLSLPLCSVLGHLVTRLSCTPPGFASSMGSPACAQGFGSLLVFRPVL